jgi:hypothetical protein
MIAIHADSLPHTKPVLIYAGREGKGKLPRQLEMKVICL